MKLSALTTALILTALSFIAQAAQEGLSDSDLASKGKRSTVLVEIGQGQNKAFGTAFCIDARGGYFITNSHVVTEGGNTSKIILNPGDATQKIINTKVVRNDTQLDLALLQSTEAVDLKACDLGTDDGLSEVQEVIAFGFPFGKELALNPADYPSISVNKGRITAFRKKEGKLHRIQIDAILNPGNSGGPILDRAGNVIGVVVSGVVGAGAVNFAIPVSHVRSFLQKPEINVTAPQLTTNNLHDELQLKAVVSGFLKSDYTAELSLTCGSSIRILKPVQTDNGAFTFKFIPVEEKKDTTVEVSISYTSGTVSGRIQDQEFKVGNRAVKLSEVQSVSLKTPEVVLTSGEKLNGPLVELGPWVVSLGDTTIPVDPSQATRVTVKRKEVRTHLSYMVKIHYGTETTECCGTLQAGSSASIENDSNTSMVGTGAATPAEAITPLPMTSEVVEVKVPSPIADLTLGGGGRYIILHLDKLRKLAIFDATKGEIVNYISVPDNILFTAGRNKLIVLVTDNNIIQRYSLDTFERELSTQCPVSGVPRAICMGSASDGPMLLSVAAGTDQLDRVSCHLVDIQRMSAKDVKLEQNQNNPLLHSSSYRDAAHFRASADGTVFGMWCTTHSPSGVGCLVLTGGDARGAYEHDSKGHVLPSADGSQIFTVGSVFTPDLKKVQGNFQGNMAYLPSPQGTFFLGIPVVNAWENDENSKKKELYVFGPGDSRPIVTIPNIGSIGKNDPWAKNDFTFDKRCLFLAKSNLIVTVPEQGDRLVLRRFNLLESLKNSQVDYLFVSSVPTRTAYLDKPFSYKISVESKRGGVKFTLDSGPKGMQLSTDGEVSWTPAEAADADLGVIVRISDASGQEIFHTFNLKVRPAQ